MKTQIQLFALGTALILGIGCSGAATAPAVKKKIVESNDDSKAQTPSLTLDWAGQTDADRFHIFYVAPKKSAVEIDSLTSKDESFASPSLTIDSSNMDSWPAAGGKACFYVVADSAGVMSDASDKACIVL